MMSDFKVDYTKENGIYLPVLENIHAFGDAL